MQPMKLAPKRKQAPRLDARAIPRPRPTSGAALLLASLLATPLALWSLINSLY